MNIETQKARSQVDIKIDGIVLFVIGVLGVVLSLRYEIGTLRRMGAGYFPLILSGIITILALIIIVMPRSEYDPFNAKKEIRQIEFLESRSLKIGITIAAGFGFIFGSKYVGLPVGAFVCVFLATFAYREFGFFQRLLFALLSSGVLWILFVWILKLNF